MLSCALHDYVEIACLYQFEIKLELRNNKSVQGIAETTETTGNKREWLIIVVNNQTQKYDLTEIISMEAITVNKHFDKIVF